MTATTPVTKCPKCGGTTIELAAFSKANDNDNDNDNLTCPTCGHSAEKSEFVADLLAQSAKLMQDAFRNIPGFKIK